MVAFGTPSEAPHPRGPADASALLALGLQGSAGRGAHDAAGLADVPHGGGFGVVSGVGGVGGKSF